MSKGQWEMYLYECTACDLLFGVSTEFEDHAIIVCPACRAASHIHDAGTVDVILTQEPEGGA